MAARRPPKAQVAWSQVKAKLSDFDRAGLITLLHDLYAASKENQAFLRSRFGLGGDRLEPYKQAIARSLWPDWNKPASVAAAKKAISGYRKANGGAEDMAELMIFFCEQAAGFIRDAGLQDERYFDALVRMYGRALAAVAALQNPRRAEQIERLGGVRALCRGTAAPAYSAVAPVARITLPQRSRSWRRNSAISAGVLPIASTLMPSSLFATSGCCSVRAIAVDSLFTIAAGVPGGATMPNQVKATNPGSA